MFETADTYLIFSEQNRLYFSGVDTSFGCVILSRSEKVFITDFRYELAVKAALEDFTVVITTFSEFYVNIKLQLERLGSKIVGFEDSHVTYSQYKEIEANLAGFEFVPASAELAAKRFCKTKEEIAKISRAQEIAEKSLAKVRQYIKSDISERELAAELLFETLKNGADGESFSTIVAFGENAAKPHHNPGDTRLEKGNCVLIDFGCKHKGYCSDMTRTFFLGEPGKQMSAIYNIVLEAQLYALQNIKAGMTGNEADSFAREYITAKGYGDKFGHSLGHGVGIDIHESPRLGKGSPDILLPGMVITVEPGIYIAGIGGVRIEDMAVVTEDGLINLTSFEKDLY